MTTWWILVMVFAAYPPETAEPSINAVFRTQRACNAQIDAYKANDVTARMLCVPLKLP